MTDKRDQTPPVPDLPDPHTVADVDGVRDPDEHGLVLPSDDLVYPDDPANPGSKLGPKR
jgi:hypothetical protein